MNAPSLAQFSISTRVPYRYLTLIVALLPCMLTEFSSAELNSFGSFSLDDLRSQEAISVIFDSWLKLFPRVYASDKQVRDHRLQIFSDNLQYVYLHNLQNASYKLGINKFADLSNQEFKDLYFGRPPSSLSSRHGLLQATPTSGFEHVSNGDTPNSVDWRSAGSVTKVKDQGACGSCWAFSTIGAIEGINHIMTGDLVPLSEQELVDCDRSHNMGCDGGLMVYAFEFIVNNGGIDSEKHYPYKGRQGQCDTNKRNTHIVTIDGYEEIPSNDESALLKAVAQQPVSVAIEAGGRDFQLYAGGILTGGCGTDLDHGVLIVGYGSNAGLDYWIVKNSWGSNWGEKGYIRMQRGGGATKKATGLCGINMMASFPLKTSANPPNPSPSPPASRVKCDSTYSCPPGNTCCCQLHLAKHCFAWGCCPLESAVCCDDHYHCCPSDFPVCNTKAGACLQDAGSSFGVAMLNRRIAESDVAAIL